MKNELTKSQIVLIKIAAVLIFLILLFGGNLIYKTIKWQSVEIIPLDTNTYEPGVYDVEGLSDEEIDDFINKKHGE